MRLYSKNEEENSVERQTTAKKFFSTEKRTGEGGENNCVYLVVFWQRSFEGSSAEVILIS